MPEVSQATFVSIWTRSHAGFRALTMGVAGCEKVTDRIGLAGWQEPRLFARCVAGADSFEIQDTLILPALCYVYVRGPRRSGIVWPRGKTRSTNTRLARMPDAVNPGTRTIGVDVGGTKVAAGFVDAQGEITQHTRTAMNPRGSAEEGLAAVTNAI